MLPHKEDLRLMSLEILSPYQHELNRHGTDCAADCPACRWVDEQESLSALAVISSPDFPELLGLAIDRALARAFARQDNGCATQ